MERTDSSLKLPSDWKLPSDSRGRCSLFYMYMCAVCYSNTLEWNMMLFDGSCSVPYEPTEGRTILFLCVCVGGLQLHIWRISELCQLRNVNSDVLSCHTHTLWLRCVHVSPLVTVE